MERNSVITNFDSKPDLELLDIASKIHEALKTSVSFNFPTGKLVGLQSQITDFTEVLIKTANGGKAEIFNKNSIRGGLLLELSDFAKMVNQQAKGNVTMLKTSGIPLWKEGDSYPEFPAPDKIKLSPGITHGEVVVEVPVNKNTRMYCIYHAPMPASADMKQWTSVLSTKHKATVTGLTPGTHLAIRAGYVGTNGKINLSETFTIFVQ